MLLPIDLSNTRARLSTLEKETLEELRFETDVLLFKQTKGGEDYTARYRAQPHFDDMVRKTVTLKNKLYGYFLDQKKNIPYLVNIYRLAADDGDDSDIDDEEDLDPTDYLNGAQWDDQQRQLSTILYDGLFAILLFGVASAENEFKYHSLLNQDSAVLMALLRKSTFTLAGDINNTTKKMIMQQIELSIQNHEGRDKLVSRLNKILSNEKRAEMIAQTESVRYYSEARIQVGVEMGFGKKTWETSVDPCPVCDDLAGETVGINDNFSSGDDYPPAHPRCKCSVELVP